MKQALLVVSFGSSVAQARAGSIAAVEQALCDATPQLPFSRVYTSPTIRRILARQGVEVPNLAQALERLAADGVDCPVVLPTHLLPGIEYDKIKQTVGEYAPRFAQVRLGGPLISTPSDLRALADVLMARWPRQAQSSVLFMGHGTEHFADLIYPALQTMFTLAERDDLHVATVEGWPALEDLLPRLTTKAVTLVPLMLTAGEHARVDMAGPQPDSWCSRLTAAGFAPTPVLEGLGELPQVRQLYADHLRALLREE
jgi:sirohydrochlorin cobaltochelatase